MIHSTYKTRFFQKLFKIILFFKYFTLQKFENVCKYYYNSSHYIQNKYQLLTFKQKHLFLTPIDIKVLIIYKFLHFLCSLSFICMRYLIAFKSVI